MKDDEIKSPHYNKVDANSVTIDQNDKSSKNIARIANAVQVTLLSLSLSLKSVSKVFQKSLKSLSNVSQKSTIVY